MRLAHAVATGLIPVIDHVFGLTFRKTIRAYEKSVFSRRLLCFTKMGLREGGLQMELEQSSFLASPEALAAIQAVEAGELEVIGSLADFNWLIDELTAN